MAIRERHSIPCDGTSCALTVAVSLPWFRQLVLQVVTVTGKGQSIQGLSLHYFLQLHLNLQFIKKKKSQFPRLPALTSSCPPPLHRETPWTRWLYLPSSLPYLLPLTYAFQGFIPTAETLLSSLPTAPATSQQQLIWSVTFWKLSLLCSQDAAHLQCCPYSPQVPASLSFAGSFFPTWFLNVGILLTAKGSDKAPSVAFFASPSTHPHPSDLILSHNFKHHPWLQTLSPAVPPNPLSYTQLYTQHLHLDETVVQGFPGPKQGSQFPPWRSAKTKIRSYLAPHSPLLNTRHHLSQRLQSHYLWFFFLSH